MSRGLVFPYKQMGSRYRPIIPIQIEHGNRSIRYEVLVDSGADMCIMPGDIGLRDGAFGMAGQKGLFDHFAIKFDYPEHKLILHKKPWV